MKQTFHKVFFSVLMITFIGELNGELIPSTIETSSSPQSSLLSSSSSLNSYPFSPLPSINLNPLIDTISISLPPPSSWLYELFAEKRMNELCDLLLQTLEYYSTIQPADEPRDVMNHFTHTLLTIVTNRNFNFPPSYAHRFVSHNLLLAAMLKLSPYNNSDEWVWHEGIEGEVGTAIAKCATIHCQNCQQKPYKMPFVTQVNTTRNSK